MICPGSVNMSRGVEDEESDFAAEGTAAHALGAACLAQGIDAWEAVGCHFHNGDTYPPHWTRAELPAGAIEVTKEMADAVQVYLDHLRPQHDPAWARIELPFHCPSIHHLMYGTSDYVRVFPKARRLKVTDYKHGAGIVVDAEENPQLMYYGVGVLEREQLWNDIDVVELEIVQPRAFHPAGPVRAWEVSVNDLDTWAGDTLVPAMNRAMVSTETRTGEHCRFCPARANACPAIMADMAELEEMLMRLNAEGGADELTNAEIGRFLELCDMAKVVGKAAESTGFKRLQAGHPIPGRKLANAKAFRKWKEGADVALKATFGDKAFELPKLKSPAQVEGLAGGKDFATRWAFKPDAGLTMVKSGDSRPEVSRDTKSLFQAVPGSKRKADPVAAGKHGHLFKAVSA